MKKSGNKSSTIETPVQKKESIIEIETKKASIPGGSNNDINYETTGNEEDVVIRDFINSKIRISGNCSSIIIENCEKSELVVTDCVFGAAMVRKRLLKLSKNFTFESFYLMIRRFKEVYREKISELF